MSTTSTGIFPATHSVLAVEVCPAKHLTITASSMLVSGRLLTAEEEGHFCAAVTEIAERESLGVAQVSATTLVLAGKNVPTTKLAVMELFAGVSDRVADLILGEDMPGTTLAFILVEENILGVR
jgi:hypothetical protein